MKIIIIGAGQGLGKVLSKMLRVRGHEVVSGFRNMNSDDWTKEAGILGLPMDVTDQEQMKAAAGIVKEQMLSLIHIYMTGILPIKKYGTHSALNMFTEYSMINPRGMAEYFGFTESEVKALCDQYGMSFEETRAWYDGYEMLVVENGEQDVYKRQGWRSCCPMS